MSEEFNYVPILKWKKGEKLALENLESNRKNKIQPLFELYDEENTEEIIADLNDYFNQPAYFDTLYIDDKARSYILQLFENIKQKLQTTLFPVLYHEDIGKITEEIFADFNQALFRIKIPAEIDAPEITKIINQIKECCQRNEISNIDLLFDAGVNEDKTEIKYPFIELKDALTYLDSFNDFINNIIVSTTCFPESLSSVQAGGSLTQPRFEMDFYKRIWEFAKQNTINLKSKLVFSDYGVAKFTDTDIDFSKLQYGVLPKTRYTTFDKYWILKGEKNRTTEEWVKNYDDLAKEIVESNKYFGEEFSYGDLKIKQRAYGLEGEGPGNHMNWVTMETNHHIAVVLEQLAKIHGI